MAITRQLLRASCRSWFAADIVAVGPRWLQFVWTIAFAASIAAFFTLLGLFGSSRSLGSWRRFTGLIESYGINFVISLTIALLIHLLFELGGWWLGAQRQAQLKGWRRTAFYAGLPTLGALVGWPLGVWLSGVDVSRILVNPVRVVNFFIGMLAISLAITFVLYQWFSTKARQLEAERRASEAQLRLLQAQMEPHFLFNTLANVHSLIASDAGKARQMLGAFTDYLRASLGQLRRESATLEQELKLARTYLSVLQMRMGDRLRFDIDASDEARAAHLPSLLLQPLVENAIQHGLEPKLEGGHVRIRARVDGQTLHIEVRDDGLGHAARSRQAARGGNGVALANLRERLAGRFGDAAGLTLDDAAPGTLARLHMPLQSGEHA